MISSSDLRPHRIGRSISQCLLKPPASPVAVFKLMVTAISVALAYDPAVHHILTSGSCSYVPSSRSTSRLLMLCSWLPSHENGLLSSNDPDLIHPTSDIHRFICDFDRYLYPRRCNQFISLRCRSTGPSSMSATTTSRSSQSGVPC